MRLAVESLPPELTVPEVFSATAGTPIALPAVATAESGIASAKWWFSYEGDDYVLDSALTAVSPIYEFELAGEYDACDGHRERWEVE